jgi:mannose-6-phosphate isomerase-like protein (cupin superfamily)
MVSRSGAPGLVKPAEARVRYETEDEGFKVGVLIDAHSHDSPLLLGLEWIRAGTEPVSWTADEQTHEVYHLLRGRLRVEWEHGETATMEPEDSFYFPPDRTYTVEPVGDDDVFLVWSVVPSPGYSDR